MKLKNILFYLSIFVFMCVQISAQNTNPEVNNVAFSITGTTVTVTYDVSDAEQGSVTIIMLVSSDGGTAWDYDYGTASGDIGTTISTGTDKGITWTYAGGYAENFKMKIIANDETADGSPYPGTPTVYDPRNGGKTYNTIQIGDQCWLKENLDVGTKINVSVAQTNNSTIEKYCYNDLDANCTTYGGLYQWNEAMQYVITEGTQGICPSAWHIPTLAEFTTLNATVLGSSSGNALKREDQSIVATNTSGFSALVAGYRFTGLFYDLGNITMFWSSTESTAVMAESLRLNFNNSNSNLYSYSKANYGFSVRCLKD